MGKKKIIMLKPKPNCIDSLGSLLPSLFSPIDVCFRSLTSLLTSYTAVFQLKETLWCKNILENI